MVWVSSAFYVSDSGFTLIYQSVCWARYVCDSHYKYITITILAGSGVSFICCGLDFCWELKRRAQWADA